MSILSATLPGVAMADPVRLGEAIRLERERQGLTQAELGARMDPKRHQVVVSGIEAGENQLKIQLLQQVCTALLGSKGLAIILLRAGAIPMDLPLEELLASAPGLSDDSRDLMRRMYERLTKIDQDAGIVPAGPSADGMS